MLLLFGCWFVVIVVNHVLLLFKFSVVLRYIYAFLCYLCVWYSYTLLLLLYYMCVVLLVCCICICLIYCRHCVVMPCLCACVVFVYYCSVWCSIIVVAYYFV